MKDEPGKFFNFLMPYSQYQELRVLARKTDLPMAELLRQGVRLVLESGERVGLKKPCV